MTKKTECARCGDEAETRDNTRGTTFWGLIQRSTETRVRTSMRVACTQYTRTEDDTRTLRTDETMPLCDPCWGLLVGRFPARSRRRRPQVRARLAPGPR